MSEESNKTSTASDDTTDEVNTMVNEILEIISRRKVTVGAAQYVLREALSATVSTPFEWDRRYLRE